MTATWTVSNLDFQKNLNGKTDVVKTVHWNCEDKDENGNSGRVYGTVSLSTDDLSNFITYSDITSEQAIAWAKAELGNEAVASAESNVAAQIAEKANPTQGSGVPW